MVQAFVLAVAMACPVLMSVSALIAPTVKMKEKAVLMSAMMLVQTVTMIPLKESGTTYSLELQRMYCAVSLSAMSDFDSFCGQSARTRW